jgi:hypothetical protein
MAPSLPMIVTKAVFWMCTALSSTGKSYQASMPTLDQARTEVIADCKKVENLCFLIRCELVGTKQKRVLFVDPD